MKNIQEKFSYKLYCAGLETADIIIADGRLHRFHILGDRRGTRNGWYILYPDFPAVGIFGCWKRHIKEKWLQHQAGILTVADTRKAFERLHSIDSICKGTFVVEFVAQQDALDLWHSAPQAYDRHGYLCRKNIGSHGLRYHRGALLIPVRDADNNFYGLQQIWPKGEKRFFKGTIVSGHFYLIGEMNSGTLLVCEGYATGATLFEVTGHSVAVCFNSHNLTPATLAIRKAWPSLNIIVCADDDHAYQNNPGLTAASTAARAANAKMVVPLFNLPRKPEDTDFNDLLRISGADAVRCSLQKGGEQHV
jgi:putative DNA primase/helicase